MEKEIYVKAIEEALGAGKVLPFLYKLEEEELEKLLACIKARLESDQVVFYKPCPFPRPGAFQDDLQRFEEEVRKARSFL